ncbi:MAG: hypothetical protein J6125_04780, partial [Clostridia bacterium]|nr:hypothetical protein [Clostridia bacterium]
LPHGVLQPGDQVLHFRLHGADQSDHLYFFLAFIFCFLFLYFLLFILFCSLVLFVPNSRNILKGAGRVRSSAGAPTRSPADPRSARDIY